MTKKKPLVMPKIPQYSAETRQVTGLTDIQISLLCKAYWSDGIDPKRCSALERQNIQLLSERHFLEFNDVAQVWRVTLVGESIVKHIVPYFDPAMAEPAGSKAGKVLGIPLNGVEKLCHATKDLQTFTDQAAAKRLESSLGL